MSRTFSLKFLILIAAFWLGGSQILLWRFLGLIPSWFCVLAAIVLAAICRIVSQRWLSRDEGRITLKALVVCLGVAAVLMLLGGEGRIFYSNIDWQVRDAVLRDMAIHPWPFVYTARPVPDLLRAPIGMFLAPALIYKAWGPVAADWALMLQNSLLIGILLAIASRLFNNRRDQLVGLTVFVVFSGLDVVGRLLVDGHLADHLESWSGLQFSSTMTLAFWVPQHAIAGWACALGFLLWQDRRVSLGTFLAIPPLTTLWSPFGVMGIIPFALFACVKDLLGGVISTRTALPVLCSIIFVTPGLIYLASAGSDVGARYFPIPLEIYSIFESLEVLPYLVPMVFFARRQNHSLWPLALVSACLLLMPFVQIGWSIDFMMRATIPSLAILTFTVARGLYDPSMGRGMKIWLIAMLAIGSITGLFEVARAVSHPPSPRGECSFFKAWDQSFASYPKASYLAPLPNVPAIIRPRAPFKADATEPARCWTGTWYRPAGV